MKKGIAASSGYAIGHIAIKENHEFSIVERVVISIDGEKKRFHKTIEKSRNQIIHIKQKASENFGEDKAEVFESHLMLLEDPEFTGAIEKKIVDEKINSEKAIKDVLDTYLAIFEAMDDEYMRERAADIKDVAVRLISNLNGKLHQGFKDIRENTIVVAADLTPSDTAVLDKNKVIAFVTNTGGRTSHSAIMARSLEIPAVVGLKDITTSVKNGDVAIVDGVEGVVIINPEESLLREYRIKMEDFEKKKKELKELKCIKAVTNTGKVIEVSGNIGSPDEAARVLEYGGDGIGLFRTEFLYMNRDSLPSEEEQYEAYKSVLEQMSGKPVLIRTLDIGGDKNLPYLEMPKESNPFLGYRAIRLCLDRKDIFKAQLRALLRASVHGQLKIMFPMISCIEEVTEAKLIIEECKEELKGEGKPISEAIEIGIMVEVPAAAINSEELAQEVDFLSIGTNDLIQYTLAADRMSEKIAYLYNPMHPAVLKLIKMTIEGAHKWGKWCGMCGEMAGDEEFTALLVRYGIDELSMSASSILKVKKAIISM